MDTLLHNYHLHHSISSSSITPQIFLTTNTMLRPTVALCFICVACNTQASSAFAQGKSPLAFVSRAGTALAASTSVSSVVVNHAPGCICPSCQVGRVGHSAGCGCAKCGTESHAPGCLCASCVVSARAGESHGASCGCSSCA